MAALIRALRNDKFFDLKVCWDDETKLEKEALKDREKEENPT